MVVIIFLELSGRSSYCACPPGVEGNEGRRGRRGRGRQSEGTRKNSGISLVSREGDNFCIEVRNTTTRKKNQVDIHCERK